MDGYISALIATISLVFVSELGDKTMISTALIAMETRRFIPVFLASISGYTLASILSIGVGYVTRRILDLNVAQLVVASLFILIGLIMAFRDRGIVNRKTKYGFTACFLMVFLSEMGDKTQLAVLTSTILYGYPLIVLIGGVIGYTLANAIALLLTSIVIHKLEWNRVRKYAGLIMITIGIYLFISLITGH
ncbi:MAG: TMEM165/GDT1 family protein [Desulfurococcaceae archaeon]